MEKNNKSKKSEKAHIHVTGMTCTTCAATIEKGLAETAGVEEAKVNFASEKATVEYDPSKVNLAKIKDTVSQLGYGVATKKSIFPVGGMTCASCVARVEEALRSVPGVISVSVNLASEKATVEYIEGTDIAGLRRAVKEAGYELGPEVKALEDVTTAAQRDIKALKKRVYRCRYPGWHNYGPGLCSALCREAISAVGSGYAGAVLGGLAVLPGGVGCAEA